MKSQRMRSELKTTWKGKRRQGLGKILFFCGLLTATASFSATGAATQGMAWQENMRWQLDVAARPVFNENDSFQQYWVGLDVHKVVSTRHGDIGTIVFQPYWVHFSNRAGTPYFFDGKQSELTWRIANFNYTALSKGGFNIRVGHFEVPFGLEQNIDTNGTLRQYTFADRGIKADWGVSANGILPRFEYEIAVSRGSGNDITDRDHPHLLSGRLGTPSHKNLIAGVSFMSGEVLGAAGTVRRERVGVDLAWYRGPWELLLEASGGRNNKTDVGNALVEVSWRNAMETVHSYTQFRHVQQDAGNGWEQGSTATTGLNFQLPYNVTLSGQWSKPLDRLATQSEHSTFTLQLRMRLP